MTTARRSQNNPKQSRDTTSSEALAPPNNLQAEAALLGAALLSASALEVLATKTAVADFYSPAHQKISSVLIEAFEKSQAADIVTIADSLKRRGDLDAIGGPTYLLTLQADTPATSSAGRYAEIIHNDATLRRLIQASAKTSEMAFSRPFDVHDAVEQAQAHLQEVASQNGNRSYSSLDIPSMADVLSGDLVQVQPTILKRSDGQALFYAGKMHVLQAEPSSGKSWIALYAAIEVLNMGGSAIYLDYEDAPAGIVGRLLALGCNPAHIAERFIYIRPSGAMGVPEKAELAALMRSVNPDLIVLDGVAEAISRDGYDEDKNTDVVKWVDGFPRWMAETGSTVVMIDHVAKDKEKSGRYARGAGHKLAAVDGAAYQIKIIHSFSRHKGGVVKLVVAKDRHGVFTIGEVAAVVRIDPAGSGEIVRMSLEKNPDTGIDDHWKPSGLMEKMSRELERSPNPLPPSLLIDLVRGNNKRGTVEEAFARLKTENFADEYKIGHTTYVRLYKAYRDGDPPAQPQHEQQALIVDEDELAKKRAEKEKKWHDDDPGPREPTD